MAQVTDDESTDDERNYSSPLHNTDPTQAMSPYGIGMTNHFGGDQDKHNNPYSNKTNENGFDAEDMKQDAYDDDDDDDEDVDNGHTGFNNFQNDSPDTPEIDDDNNGYGIIYKHKQTNTCHFCSTWIFVLYIFACSTCRVHFMLNRCFYFFVIAFNFYYFVDIILFFIVYCH